MNFSGGMEPLTIGGSFTLAEILGTVPVEPDGSAYFEVPALRSVFFVALDENDLAVKRMHSFVTVQPGETTGCVGCHEQRDQLAAPSPPDLLAMRRPPSRIEPIADVPACSISPATSSRSSTATASRATTPTAARAEGGPDGDKTAMYTISYWTMQTRGLVSDGRNRPTSNRAAVHLSAAPPAA